MVEQERINADVQKQLALQDAKFNAFVEEMRDFKNEMRQQNKMRAEEIREIRQDMREMQNRLDAKIDGIGKHVQNLTVTAMVGVGTSVIAVVVLIGTTIYALLSH